MSQDRAAALTATELDIQQRFADLGIPDPEQAAARFLRWLTHDKGFRQHPELMRDDSPPNAAPPAVARKHLDQARAVVADVRKQLQATETTEEGK